MDLSVIIPARNEEFLQETIDNVAANRRGDTEIIAVLDGYKPDIKKHKGVVLLHNEKAIGQRQSVNLGVKASGAKYIMKLDGHCAVDEGFDVKLMADCEPDWTVVPRMYNLHAFNWQCLGCGHETMQGPPIEKCEKCGHAEHVKRIIWEPKWRKMSDFMLFDSNMKFGYWYDYKKRPEAKPDIADQMCAVGACFFMERDRFWALGGMDEKHGGWGQMGVEVACKAWLSGGKQVVNKKTWFAHMFRTNNKGFSFPYEISGKDVHKARKHSRDLWKNNKWPLAVRNLDWLLRRFAPIPGWEGVEKLDKTDGPLLSVIIPARNEKYLQATIDDMFKNFKTDFEIIVGLDNYEPDPPLKKHDRVRVYNPGKRVGMRTLINKLVKMSNGKYVLKTDAHCAFDEGYDEKLIGIYEPGATVLGVRYELDVEKWERKERTNCDFRYLSNPDVDELGGLRGLPWHEWKEKTKGQKVAESMSLSGSGWLMEKEQFMRWGGLDAKNHGMMYQEGAEIACKTWLSGGRLLINRDTWYAHWNRGKAPYALGKYNRDKSIDYSIDLWMGNNWPQQKYSFNWLIDKFKPPGWPAPKHEGLKAPAQGALYKGARNVSVQELWEKRLGISELAKRYRLEIFFKAFDKFLDGDEKPYYYYLLSHRSKVPKTPTDRDIRHVKRKMEGAKRLYEDIKQNGLMAPLEFYHRRGKLYLVRGYRRLAIIHKLGYKKTSIRMVLKEDASKKLCPGFAWKKGSISELGAKQFAKYGGLATDKWWVHNYLQTYDRVFDHLRVKHIKILEIGLLHGSSLRLWQQAFPKAQIFGFDKNKTMWKRMTKGLKRIRVVVGNEDNPEDLKRIASLGDFHIIIDDCGHMPDQQWAAFCALWPRLKPGGYYVIEDTYRSFNPKYAGRNVPNEFSNWLPSIYNDFEVASLQFHYNLCIVQKGLKK